DHPAWVEAMRRLVLEEGRGGVEGGGPGGRGTVARAGGGVARGPARQPFSPRRGGRQGARPAGQKDKQEEQKRRSNRRTPDQTARPSVGTIFPAGVMVAEAYRQPTHPFAKSSRLTERSGVVR